MASIFQNEKDDKNAERYFKKAADEGHSGSKVSLWKLYNSKNQADLANHYLESAVIAGNAEAIYQMGLQCEKRKDYNSAFKHIYKAMMSGNALAKETLNRSGAMLASYYSLYKAMEQKGDTFDERLQEMSQYLILQKALGYYFVNGKHLLDALDRTIDPDTKEAPYQKLEFLGDGVLSTAIRERFVDKAPKSWLVGDLEKATQPLLSNTGILPKVAKKLKLSALINLDENEKNRPVTDKMQADAMEALIGAVFQDYGFSKTDNSDNYYVKAKFVVYRLWEPYLATALKADPRSILKQSVENTSNAAKNTHHPQPVKPTRSLSPASQRVFCILGTGTPLPTFSKALSQMSDINCRNIGKRGDTALMTLVRKDIVQTPKVKALLKHGALWTATNNEGKSAEKLLETVHPNMAEILLS